MSTEAQKIESIRKIVKKTLEGDFDNIRISKIDVHKDTDADGDEVLRIFVVFEGKPKDLNAEKLTGAVRMLRPQLDKIHESAFPMLSFISKSDYKAARAC